MFALVKSSLDCRHVCLLEGVLLLAGCCERVFLPLLSSVDIRFYVADLTSVFYFLRMNRTVDMATPNVPAISL